MRRLVEETIDRVTPGAGAAPSAGAPEPTAAREPAHGSPARWVRWIPAAPATPPARRMGIEPFPEPLPAAGRAGAKPKPVVAVGSDHSAVTLKRQIVRYLREELGYPVLDCGAPDENPVDYPDIARRVGAAVVAGAAARGIVIDAMGVGSTMAANKVNGVRCALCHDEATTRNAREHNDANVLALGSRVVNAGVARGLVRLFLTTAHAGGRHARRVAKIRDLESAARSPDPPDPSERGKA